MAFSPDGLHLALAGGFNAGSPGRGDKTLRIWKVVRNRLVRELKGHTGWLTRAAYSPDGRSLLSGGVDGTARLWDTATERLLHTLQAHAGTVHDVASSPDGARVATAAADHQVRL
jgi:WD40 repeat protein